MRLIKACRYFLIGFPLLALSWQSVQAEDESQKLENLGSNISKVERELAAAKRQRKDINLELKRRELQISKLSRQLHDLETSLDKLKRRQNEQKRDYQRLADRFAGHQEYLARHLRTAYRNGNQPFLKLLLSQENPSSLGRMLSYYRFYGTAHQEKMVSIREDMGRISEIQQALSSRTEEITQLAEQYSEQRAALVNNKRERKLLLSKVSRNIASKSQQLGQLQNEKKQLEELIERLRRAPLDDTTDLADKPAFSSLKGRLGWPTLGKLKKRYHSRVSGKLKLQGIIIAAREGRNVHAVSHGRVVFADWLPGYGLVTIVDHGKGYLSLYGYNQSLLKEKGDWVDTGDILAQVGNSGGHDETALYFEVRHRGKTMDPLSWLNRKRDKLAGIKP